MINKKFVSKIALLGIITSALFIQGCATNDVMQSNNTDAQDCDLSVFENQMQGVSGVKVGKDPAGIALEAEQDLSPELKKYATANQCRLYVIDMQKMVKGLLKGNNVTMAHDNQFAQKSYKYIVMPGKKARCADTLGLKLPISAYGVEK